MYLADCSFAGQRMTRKNFRLVISGIDYLNDVKICHPGSDEKRRTEPNRTEPNRTILPIDANLFITIKWNKVYPQLGSNDKLQRDP